VQLSRVGGGVARPATRVRLGAATPLVLLALLALIVLALGVPLGSLTHWLLVGSSTAFPIGELASAAGTSLLLGLIAALAASALALPVAWLVTRRGSAVATIMERATYVGSALPGIVVALALVTVTIRHARPLYQTTAMLIGAYVILYLPRALVSQRAALQQSPPLLDDVAAALGSGPLTRLRRVTLPLIAPGVGAGAALVFLAVVTELTATLLLSPTGTRTLATAFWSETGDLDYGAAAPYAALMVLLSLPATLLLTRDPRRTRRTRRRGTTA
jgi:iron(III) transport system permease protein